MKKNFLLGVGVTNEKTKYILEYILSGLAKKNENYYVVTPNPEILVYANSHKGFQDILNNARLALCDGVGLLVAGKFVGKPFVERTTGTDFVKMVCEAVAKKPITVGFLGGRDGVAESTADCLISKYPGLRVVYAGSQWPVNDLDQVPMRGSTQNRTQKNAEKDNGVVQRIDQRSSAMSIDILFVAYGFPRQEEWMAANLSSDIYRVAIGVGGAFDYISKRVPRAPLVVRAVGLEWLFRLLVQPWRIKRQLALFTFILLVLQERFLTKGNRDLVPMDKSI